MRAPFACEIFRILCRHLLVHNINLQPFVPYEEVIRHIVRRVEVVDVRIHDERSKFRGKRGPLVGAAVLIESFDAV